MISRTYQQSRRNLTGKLPKAPDGGRAFRRLLKAPGRRRRGEITLKSPHTYYEAVTGGSFDSRSLCGSATPREAEGARIAVVREVKGGQTFPPYDYADSFGGPPEAVIFNLEDWIILHKSYRH